MKNNLVSSWKEEAIRLAVNTEMSWRAISAEVGVPKSTVSDYLRQFKGQIDTARGLISEDYEPKILIYDIENSPLIGAVWTMWNTNMGVDAVIEHQYVLTWAAKWLGDSVIMSDKLTNYPRFEEDHKDDFFIIQSLWELFEEADVIIAHNNDRHDMPWLNMRANYHGFPRYSPTKVVDTLKAVKRAFKLPSNSLKYIAKYFGLELKLENAGMSLWMRCREGERAAFDEMEEYNIGDLFPLEQIYLKARPYITNHPNLSLFDNKLTSKRCPRCYAKNSLVKLEKNSTTGVSVFEAFRCTSCGSVVRDRKNILTKEQRENVLTNTM